MTSKPRSTSRFVSLLATTCAVAYVLVATPVLSSLAMLAAVIPPRGNATLWVARLWARGLLAAGGVRVEVSVDPRLDPTRSHVFLANHQSYFDIPILLATVPGQIRFAAKRSLFHIPIFGWAIAAGGFIPVDRDDRSRARQALTAAAERLAHGTSVLFFPEGTRSHDGNLLPFKRGGMLLALKSGLPIVPVGVGGAHAVQPRGRFAVYPGKVRVRFGPPIATAEYGLRRKSELLAEVRRRIAELAGVEEG